jgi:ribosome-associated heat shock protein Hsp15
MSEVRIDRWLWAARFFRTRSLAAAAVGGGRVHVNGQAAKPGKPVRVGDRLEIGAGRTRFVVDVLAVAERRGPAHEAAALYAETGESRAERERVAELRRLAATPRPDLGGRPTKRDRRRLERERGR